MDTNWRLTTTVGVIEIRAYPCPVTHLYLSTENDSLYLDVTAGDRAPVDMTEIADGVLLHVDDAGALVGIEVLDLSRRGGFRIDDLDATGDEARPPVFEQIERLANRDPRGGAQ